MRDLLIGAMAFGGVAAICGGLYVVWWPLSLIAFGSFLLYAAVKIAQSDIQGNAG